MNLYDEVATDYRRLVTRQRPSHWQAELGDLDQLINTIRDDHPDPARSDAALRHLLELSRNEPDALTIVLHALAPALKARTGRAVTDAYRADTLTDLTFVLLDRFGLDRPGLAHRLVNRAHNRTHKAATRTYERGATRTTSIAPHAPDRITLLQDATADHADTVVAAVDLARFHTAVSNTITAGRLTRAAWAAYRDHRLRRTIDPDAPVATNSQRKLATRAARRLQPLVETLLHAA